MAAAYLEILRIQRDLRRRQHQVPRVIRDRRNPIDFMTDRCLVERYRLDRDAILYLCNAHQQDLQRPTCRSSALPVSIQVVAALRYFATGSFQAVTGDVHGISRFSVSRSVHTVAFSIVNRLMNTHIKFPFDPAEVRATKEAFYNLANFPNVYGALDGTLIPIRGPSVDEHLYFSHKVFHAINVQCVVAADGRFLDVVARWPGASHDALIWRNSELSHQFEQGNIMGGWLLGDSGYPLLPWLLTPIHNPVNRPQRAYNRAHKTTRCSCERAFGVWKARWRCLHKSGGSMMFAPERCVNVITATTILENICKERHLPAPEFDFVDANAEGEPIEEGPMNEDGIRTRNRIIQTYFNN